MFAQDRRGQVTETRVFAFPGDVDSFAEGIVECSVSSEFVRVPVLDRLVVSSIGQIDRLDGTEERGGRRCKSPQGR